MSFVPDTHQLAWAAGFFDGEGHASFGTASSTYKPRLTCKISQIDRQVLDRFCAAVQVGTVKPLNRFTTTGNLVYEFSCSSFEEAQHVAAVLWKFLSPIKRAQFAATLTRMVAGSANNPHRKLTPTDVREIRTLLASGCTGTALAVRFGVDHALIYGIKNGKNWKNVR